MMASFCEIQEYMYEISIINRRIILCGGANKEEKLLDGVIEKVVFDSDSWSTVIICCLGKGQKAIYSLVVNHKLVRKLEIVSKLSKVVQEINIAELNI